MSTKPSEPRFWPYAKLLFKTTGKDSFSAIGKEGCVDKGCGYVGKLCEAVVEAQGVVDKGCEAVVEAQGAQGVEAAVEAQGGVCEGCEAEVKAPGGQGVEAIVEAQGCGSVGRGCEAIVEASACAALGFSYCCRDQSSSGSKADVSGSCSLTRVIASENRANGGKGGKGGKAEAGSGAERACEVDCGSDAETAVAEVDTGCQVEKGAADEGSDAETACEVDQGSEAETACEGPGIDCDMISDMPCSTISSNRPP